MENELKILVDNLREKIGVQMALFNADGVCVAGVAGASEKIDTSIQGFFSDKINGRTLFVVEFKNKKYFGRISGCGTPEENYALLIKQLIENYSSKEGEMSRQEFNRAILLGKINYSQLRSYENKFELPSSPCFAMVVNTINGKVDDLLELAKSFGNPKSDFVVKNDDTQLTIVKFLDTENEDYYSSSEYAEAFLQSALEEAGVKVEIYIGGTVKSIGDLNSSYAQAMSAIRMSKTVQSKGNIHSFKEFMLLKTFEDLPKYKLTEYLQMLMDAEAKVLFADEDMINTAEEFLENSLNVSETSRKLFMHRNTLTYRLDKIEKMTGLNIRKFSDAVTFRYITILNKLVK